MSPTHRSLLTRQRNNSFDGGCIRNEDSFCRAMRIRTFHRNAVTHKQIFNAERKMCNRIPYKPFVQNNTWVVVWFSSSLRFAILRLNTNFFWWLKTLCSLSLIINTANPGLREVGTNVINANSFFVSPRLLGPFYTPPSLHLAGDEDLDPVGKKVPVYYRKLTLLLINRMYFTILTYFNNNSLNKSL